MPSLANAATKHTLRAAARFVANRLFKGLVIIVPIVVSLYAVLWLGAIAERAIAPLLRLLLPEDGALQYRPGMGVVLAVVLIFLVGIFTYSVVFRRAMDVVGSGLERIPLINSLYGGLRDLMDLVSRTRNEGQLNEVVALDLPDGTRMLGFISQPDPQRIPEPLVRGEDYVAVYLPMSYQIGGYTVYVSRSRVRPIEMTVMDAMRSALTAGMSGDRVAPTPPHERQGPEKDWTKFGG